MSDNLINFYDNILFYNQKTVFIAFSDKTFEPFFHANQICKLLGFKYPNDAIKNHVKNDKHIVQLQNIVKNYKSLYKNVQGHTKFLDEAGLYFLVMGSKKHDIIPIKNWIVEDVMPSLRKHGRYEFNKKIAAKLDTINGKFDSLEEQIIEKNKKISDQEKLLDIRNSRIKELENETSMLKHDLKKTKFQTGGAVYIMRPISNYDDLTFDPKKIIFMKIGKTIDMNTRCPTLNTGSLHNVKILKSIPVKNHKVIEKCVHSKLEDFRVRADREFFECSYDEAIGAVADCIWCHEKRNIDLNPDSENNKCHEIELSRSHSEQNLDRNEKMQVYIINDDDDFNNINEIVQNGGSCVKHINYVSQDENNFISSHNFLSKREQYIFDKYMKYKRKYLESKKND